MFKESFNELDMTSDVLQFDAFCFSLKCLKESFNELDMTSDVLQFDAFCFSLNV